jgi:HEAT repeat protein
MVRLSAVGALLKIADRDYSLLMRDYLNNTSVPIQMQALEQVLMSTPDPTYLLLFLQDADRALPFRIRVIEALTGRLGSAVPLAAMFHATDEPPELRGRIAHVLATIGGPTAHNLLAEVALRSDDHIGVRLACIEALRQRHDLAATNVFATIITMPDEHASIHERSMAALIQLLTPMGGAA